MVKKEANLTSPVKMRYNRLGIGGIQMKKLSHMLLGRLVIGIFAMLLQFAWMFLVLYQFSIKFTYMNLLIRIIAVLVVLSMVYKWINPSYKVSWTFLLLLSPVLGILTYYVFGRSKLTKRTRERLRRVNQEVVPHLAINQDVLEEVRKKDESVYCQSKYINDWAKYPVYENTSTSYYRCGEEMFPEMLRALESAKTFYFSGILHYPAGERCLTRW